MVGTEFEFVVGFVLTRLVAFIIHYDRLECFLLIEMILTFSQRNISL